MNPLISEDEVNALIEQCRSGDTEQKRRAVEALEKAHATQAVPVVLKLLEHEDEFVRLDAVCMVGRLGQEKLDEVGPALIQRLADVDESVRDQAAEALSLLRYQPARAALEKMLLGDAYWVARASAAEALGELGDAQAVPALLQALTNELLPGASPCRICHWSAWRCERAAGCASAPGQGYTAELAARLARLDEASARHLRRRRRHGHQPFQTQPRGASHGVGSEAFAKELRCNLLVHGLDGFLDGADHALTGPVTRPMSCHDTRYMAQRPALGIHELCCVCDLGMDGTPVWPDACSSV